jgi:glyoxylase-like metal-dependent hydrolase (beta-lactamase superfamily II)
MYEITNNVFLVGSSSKSHSYDCMCYLVKCPDGCVLIDTGAGLDTGKIENNIKSLGFEKGPSGVILTHCHIDHVGGASYFKSKYGSKLYAADKDCDAIEGRKLFLVAADWYPGVNYNPVRIDVKLEMDCNINISGRGFNIIATPGHTPGSLCVLIDDEGQKVLFAQDAHGPFVKEWGSDIKAWKESMDKLLSLDADVLCEGHYGIYYKEQVREFIETQIDNNYL